MQEQSIIQPSKRAGRACTKEQMMCAQSGETQTGALTARVRHWDSIWSTVGTTQELEQSCIILGSKYLDLLLSSFWSLQPCFHHISAHCCRGPTFSAQCPVTVRR